MYEDGDDRYGDDFEKTLMRFERNRSGFFEVEEFEDIIDHYFDMGDANMVEVALDIALNIYPASTELLLKKSEYLIETDKCDEAIELLNRLQRLDPLSPDVYFLRGQALYIQGNEQDAIDHFERSINLCYNDIADMSYAIAKFLLDEEDVENALRYLLKAHLLDSDNVLIMMDLALCYESTDKPQKSIELLNRIIDIDSYNQLAWLCLGGVYYRLTKYDEAISALDYALAIDPQYAEAVDLKVDALIEQGKVDEAIGLYMELLAEDADNPMRHIRLGDIYAKTSGNDLDYNAYMQALLLDPKCAEAHNSLGLYHMKRNEYAKAIEYLKKATELNPDVYIFWMDLGYAYSNSDDYSSAIEAYGRALEINSDEMEIYLLVAEALFNMQRFSEVLLLLTFADKMLGNNVQVKLILAVVLYLLEQKDDALAILKQANEIDPTAINLFLNVVGDNNIDVSPDFLSLLE